MIATGQPKPVASRFARLRELPIHRAPGLLARFGWIVGLVVALGGGGLLIETLLGHPALGGGATSGSTASLALLWAAISVGGLGLALGMRVWLNRLTASLPPARPRVPASLQADARWDDE